MAIMIDNQTGPVNTNIFYEGGANVLVTVLATNWNSSNVAIFYTDDLGNTDYLPVGSFGNFSSNSRQNITVMPAGVYKFQNNGVIGLSISFIRIPQ